MVVERTVAYANDIPRPLCKYIHTGAVAEHVFRSCMCARSKALILICSEERGCLALLRAKTISGHPWV
jgi:hypothetical protein